MPSQLDECVHVFQTHGTDIGPDTAMRMLLRILPERLPQRITEQPEVQHYGMVQLLKRLRLQHQFAHQMELAPNVSQTPCVAAIQRESRRGQDEAGRSRDEPVNAVGAPLAPTGARPPRPARGNSPGGTSRWPVNPTTGKPFDTLMLEIKGC